MKPGERIGHYEIEQKLGHGGMGEVYVARDTRLGRRVAIKRILGGADATARARLMREARVAAALEHPGAVTVLDVGEHDGAPYIAMKFVRGRTLRAFVADASAPMSRRVRWLVDVARALGAAQRAGIVHRDVKPENVMLRDDGAIKVLDFGIARRAADGNTPTPGPDFASVTEEGVMIGMPRYASPEQLRGEKLDSRSGGAETLGAALEILDTAVEILRPAVEILDTAREKL